MSNKVYKIDNIPAMVANNIKNTIERSGRYGDVVRFYPSGDDIFTYNNKSKEIEYLDSKKEAIEDYGEKEHDIQMETFKWFVSHGWNPNKLNDYVIIEM